MEMTFTKAVNMIKSGDSVEYNRGYEYLYYATYNVNKWDIEKILGNEQDAEDILQNAYIKMLSKIDTLEDPEKFPAWFNRLATNMAIDVWRAQHPKKKGDDSGDSYRRVVSFSEFEYTDGDGEAIEYEWEDESIEFRPEEAYTQQETVDMVHEMLKNLPEEQKACLVMFHLQGLSIKEIAEHMQVSENTVKSRLNYARKNIEAQGEELKKKGYQLYSYAPLPLLLCLLGAQRGTAAAADSYWAGVTVSNWSMGVGSAAATGEAVVQGSAAMSSSTAYGAAATTGQGVGQDAGTAGYGAAATTGQGTAGAVAGQTGVGAQVEVGVQAGVGAQTGIGTQAGAQMAGQAGTTGMQQAVTQAAVKTAGKKTAGGFLGTIGGKVAVAVGSVALITVGAIAVTNHIKDKDETTTTEQLTEVTEEVAETTEVTTEATTEEVIDERGLLVTYYQDTLVPEYGLFPEYQANENKGDAKFEGILCSDIDDYNQDGVLDLVVIRNYDETVNANGGYKEVTHAIELYTVEDSQVTLMGKTEDTSIYHMLPNEYMTQLSAVGGIDHVWKVKTDDKIYLMSSYFGYYVSNIASVHLYTYDNDKIQCVRYARGGDGADTGTFIVGYEYENGVQTAERQLTDNAEEFFGELGIVCSIDRHDTASITFENENQKLYTLYNGGREHVDDVSVQFESSNVEAVSGQPSDNPSDETMEDDEASSPERTLYEEHIQRYLEDCDYVPDYKQDILTNIYTHSGVIYYDIDDYNHDGVQDLYMITKTEGSVLDTSYPLYKESIEVHNYYTIENGSVKKIGEIMYDEFTGYSVPSSSVEVSMCKQADKFWKVKVGDDIYFVKQVFKGYGYGGRVEVYGYDGDQIRLLRKAIAGTGSAGRYYAGEIYEGGTLVDERTLESEAGSTDPGMSAESFFAELGINCVITTSSDNVGNTIEFENEAQLVYELHSCGKDGNEDTTIQYTPYYDRIEDETEY